MAAKRVARKELMQPDEFLSFSQQMLEKAIKHKGQLLAGLAGVLGVILLIALAVNHFERKERTAAEMLGQAQALMKTSQAGEEETGGSEKALELLTTITDKYTRTRACQVARVLLGHIYFREAKYDEALSQFEAFLKRDNEALPEITALALEGMAYCHEEKQEYQKALEFYQELGKSELSNFQGWALMGLARVQEMLGQPQAALEAYRKLLLDHPHNVNAEEAKAHIARISQQLTVKPTSEGEPEAKPDA